MTECIGVFNEKMKRLLKDDYSLYEASLKSQSKRALSLNTLKIDTKRFEKVFCEKMSRLPYWTGYMLATGEKLGRHPLSHAGAFYLQDPSAMLPVSAVDLSGRKRILDLCSAPGGKALQISQISDKDALIFANEYDISRASILTGNIERAGAKNIVITSASTEYLSSLLPNYFDAVFVDAPCSGEGMFRKYPEAIKEWNENLPQFCAKRQKAIIYNADSMLKEGGLLVYSTCTFNEEENENVVEYALSLGYKLVDAKSDVVVATVSGLNGLTQARRSYPFLPYGEGQFLAVMEKTKETGKGIKESEYGWLYKPSKEEQKLVEELTCLIKEKPLVAKCGDELLLLPQTGLPITLKKTICTGVRLGMVAKGRIEPHHSFFSAYGNEMSNRVDLELSDERVEKYLRGEVISGQTKNGFGAICIEGCAVGGFKAVNGQLKNRYPKGLRNF